MIFKRITYALLILTLFCQTIVLAQSSNSTYSITKMSKPFIQPLHLKAGDSVAIVAPSGILRNREKEINQAKDLLKSWGLKVIVGEHVFKKAKQFAGTDDQRAEDFQNALDKPNIKAIRSARAG